MADTRIVRICKECGHFNKKDKEKCKSPQAPVTDFVMGTKDPVVLNQSGKCDYYTPRT